MLARLKAWSAQLDTAVQNATGKQLLSMPVFLVGLFSSTMLRVLGTPFGVESSLWDQLLDSWLAYLTFWFWIQTVTRWLIGLGPTARYGVAATVLFGAAGRGALVHFLITEHEHEPVELLGYRMLSGFLLVGLVMLLTSYAMNALSRQTGRLDQLVAYRRVLTEALEQSSVELDDWFKQLLVSTKGKLLEQIGPEPEATIESFGLRLKALIANAVRPISSELARGLPPNPKIQDPELIQKYNLRRIAEASSTLDWRTRPMLTPAVIGLLSVPSIYVFGTASIFEVFVGFVLLQSFGLWAANFVFERRPESWSVPLSATLLQLLILLANLLPAYYTVWVIGFFEARPSSFHNSAAILTVGFSLVTLLVATVDATSRGVRQLESELERTVEELRWHLAKTKGEMWRRQQALARALHGPLQATLTAHSIRIDLEKSPARSRDLIANAITETYESIRSIDALLLPSLDIEGDLNRIIERWRGISQVHIDYSGAALELLQRDSAAAQILLDLLQDALSNAVRHGAATECEIDIVLSAHNQVRVVVTDNGNGLSGTTGAGVGSLHLDVLTTGWLLRNRQDGLPGTHLEFFVPADGGMTG